MKTSLISLDIQNLYDSNEEKTTKIEKHRQTSIHLMQASKNHNEAANHLESGNHDKALSCTLEAHKHLRLACDLQTSENM